MNSYSKIFFKPKDVIEQVYLKKDEFNIRLILGLFAVSQTIDILTDSKYDLIPRVIGFVIVAFLLTLMYWYFSPWLFKMVGKLWNGQGTISDIRKIFALACVPYVVLLIPQLLNLLVGKNPGLEALGPFLLIAFVFSMRVFLPGLAKIQGFPIMNAVLNLVLPILLFTVIGLLLAQ